MPTSSSLIAANGLASAGLLGVLPLYRGITSSVGSYTDEAGAELESDRVLATPPGYNGAGINVGVLSDSYNNLGGAGRRRRQR